MPGPSVPAWPSRAAVVDLGSNSVRLVVYEGAARNPLTVFNEKAVLRLGRGLQETGLLNPEGVAEALAVMRRYDAIARAMGAPALHVLATAAVRDASNGAAFVADLEARVPGIVLRILSGEEEARLSALGTLCGIPRADGILADIGGGSLEVVRLRDGAAAHEQTLPLGVIRLADRARGDLDRARAIAADDLAAVPWLAEGRDRDLYLVGGAWRSLARIHMAQTNYPLAIVHHYAIAADRARAFAAEIAGAGRRGLERLPAVSRRRIDDLPFAATVLRRLLRVTEAGRVVFSASGLREGWLMSQLPAAVLAEDPLLAAAQDFAHRLAREPALPPALIAWTAALFPGETDAGRQLREAACWISDVGSRDHPEYRAEQAALRMLRQPAIGLDHPTRAWLAMVVALRYEMEAEAPLLAPLRLLLDPETGRQAALLGMALRLAYTLSGGTIALLQRTSLVLEPRRLVLQLGGDGVFAGESVLRRLERLAQALGVAPVVVAHKG